VEVTTGPYRHFPVWVRVVYTLVPFVLAFAIAVQRDALVPPGWPAVLAALAALPWVRAFLPDARRARYCSTAWQLGTAALVIGAVLLLVLSPEPVDIAPFFLVYLAASSSIEGPAWVSGVVVAASVAMLVLLDLTGQFNDVYVWVLGIVAAWAGGAASAKQQRLIDELRAAEAELATRAAAEERRRIAREIHDVVAHTLAVTMLQLTGARMVLRRDPDDAELALRRAEQLGRESLAEIRRTVGLLDDGAGTAVPALPAAADIPELVREFSDAGLHVELNASGDARSLNPNAGLALYRIVQESLANVSKHAVGAHACVDLRIDDDRVRLRIWNALTTAATPPADCNGHGIAGMAERAMLLGGTLRAGPGVDGWTVDVDLPLELELT
jgi:signal transduction histidine kinase